MGLELHQVTVISDAETLLFRFLDIKTKWSPDPGALLVRFSSF